MPFPHLAGDSLHGSAYTEEPGVGIGLLDFGVESSYSTFLKSPEDPIAR